MNSNMNSNLKSNMNSNMNSDKLFFCVKMCMIE